MNTPTFDISVHAQHRPDAIAVIDETLASGPYRTSTYAQFADRTARLANALASLGLQPGDHVAGHLGSGIPFLEIYWAALRSGLIFTAVSDSYTADEASYVIDNCDARVTFVSDTTVESVQTFMDTTTQVQAWIMVGAPTPGFLDYEEVIASAPSARPTPEPLGSPMYYTSGSTGRPKGVLRELSGRAFAQGSPYVADLQPVLGLDHTWVYLSPTPLHHAASTTYAEATLATGGKVVLSGRFDPEGFLDLVDRHRVNLVQIVPTMMIRLIRLPQEIKDRYDVSSFKLIVHGAGPCPVDVKREFIQWMGPVVFEYYGATEGIGHTFITSPEWLAHPGSVGVGAEGITIHIVDDSGSPVPTGEDGVIYFESSQAMASFEYHKTDAAAAARHPDHDTWATLGDRGYLDEDGYLYLSGRTSDLIVRGGVNVYPREVEDGLRAHPAVYDVAVLAVPHEELAEEVGAVVELAPELEPTADLAQELMTFARARMAKYKAPTRLAFVDQMPRTPTGKLTKTNLVSTVRDTGHAWHAI